MKIYLSGRMSGVEDSNWPMFDATAQRLRAEGHDVVSPADISRKMGLVAGQSVTEEQYAELMKLDIVELLQCDAIFMLPGWERSRGAGVEIEVAKACGLEVLP